MPLPATPSNQCSPEVHPGLWWLMLLSQVPARQDVFWHGSCPCLEPGLFWLIVFPTQAVTLTPALPYR